MTPVHESRDTVALNVLDQLIAAEKEATTAPWYSDADELWCDIDGIPWQVGELNLPFVALLRNHAADLIAAVKAAKAVHYWLWERDAHFLDDEEARRGCEDAVAILAAALAPLLTTEGSDE